eukprot:scaffold8559_cov135-Skeletonema_marinoi.AAC.8
MPKTAATNQSISAAVAGDSGEVTSPVTPPSARGSDDRPKRKKMLSFVPKAETSAIDSTAANRVHQGSHEESLRSQKARDGDGKDIFRAHASEVVQLTLTTAEDDNDNDAPKKSDEFLYDGDDLDEESQEGTISQKYDDDSHIIRATKKDYFFTGLLVFVMCCLVGVVVGWPTRLDESDSIFSKTPCDVYDQDYCFVRLLVLVLLGVWMIVVVLSVVVGMRREVV